MIDLPPIEACDVKDKEAATRYREKRAEWVGLLRGPDRHSVANQISNMLWSDATFRTINETRRLASEAEGEFLATNGFLGEFIDAGYVSIQALAIRRLVDRPSDYADRQPISLRRLSRDIGDHRELFTREVCVCFDGLPFDYGPMKDRELEQMAQEAMEQNAPVVRWGPPTGPGAWSTSQRAHEWFDRISGTGPAPQNRHDRIPDSVFRKVSDRLAIAEIDQIVRFADKFIAHAADSTARSGLGEEEKNITMGRVDRCHAALIETSQMIGDLLWDGGGSHFPVPQFDPLKGLDAQWVRSDMLEEARRFWDQHIEAIERILAAPLTP